MSNCDNLKTQLRRECRMIRKNVIQPDIKSDKICDNLINNDIINSADTVLAYFPIGSEVRTQKIIEHMLSLGKTVALPKCLDNGIMHFHRINSADELVSGKYDIPEPPEDAPTAEITGKTVCLVPALAFTHEGFRLGYGGGYYDRFISANPSVFTFGLVYSDLLLDSIPTQPHDMKVNIVVTEERTVLCNVR